MSSVTTYTTRAAGTSTTRRSASTERIEESPSRSASSASGDRPPRVRSGHRHVHHHAPERRSARLYNRAESGSIFDLGNKSRSRAAYKRHLVRWATTPPTCTAPMPNSASAGLREPPAGPGNAIGRARHVVEPEPVAERDRRGVAAVLAADAHLHARLHGACALDGELHQLADPAPVEGLERVLAQDAVVEVVRGGTFPRRRRGRSQASSV